MSASLVGSEMCIRDSTTRDTQRRAEQERMHARAAMLGPGPPGAARCPSCLLYTSDAADDM
eukprot:9266211-Alexandrium_andersonii.AAC.1